MASRGYIGVTPADTPFDTSPFIEMLRGAISGLVQSNAADADHDITLSAGGALDDTHSAWMKLSSTLTKQIDAAWAEGDAAGGLDSGSVANSTWYYIWLIKNPSSGTVDALFSTSSSSPTMPSGYSLKRLVGAVLTDGSANIVAFKAYELSGGGVHVRWKSPQLDVNLANTLGTTARLDTISVPSGFPVIADISTFAHDATTVFDGYVSSPDSTDIAADANTGAVTFRPHSTSAGGAEHHSVPTSTGQVRSRAAGTVDTYRIQTYGWDWSRR
jgi:hypothetical protein